MSKDGNILLVANWESNVGYAWWLMENFWITISDHFAKQGKISYLIYPKITKVPESIACSGIKASECNFRDRSFANLRKLHRFIRSHNINYIYLTDSPAYSLLYLLLRLWGIKKIVVHDHTPGERTLPNTWLKILKGTIQRIPFYTADHFISVTDFVYRRCLEVSCIPENKCSCAPNGIVPIDLNGADLKYAHHCFNIPEQRLIVVTTGRASYYKGIDFFIECAAELINRQGLGQLHFLFCGDGPDIEAFRTLAKRLDIEDNFTFAGKRTDLRQILPSCHIGFHAATGEVGYSLSILEYMSAGLVTIVPDRPSTSLATRNMQNGLLYRPRDLQSAIQAIKNALNLENTVRVRKNAVRDAQEIFNISNTNKKLIEALQLVFNIID